ncbi:RNA polymerase sigma factor [Roseospirillum parvum]|uniref:RNA polymerase sigma factor n=1 Tax=Roseospirillum parvum TaxID=83401 RepID=A0A1G8ANK0_9PROT|nr:RNA polymerase sigma factor [Roseospirillum parvum]SDH22316.1 RNA polymerase sigma-70 factor, ECF subfamily [Roseospirillum parvum]
MTGSGRVADISGSRVSSSWMGSGLDSYCHDEPRGGTSDESLMERTQEGDKEAFRLLVSRHVDRVVGMARRIVGPDQAEDVAQDVFLKIWANSRQWQPGQARFRTWLYRVALNQCIDLTRRRATVPIEQAGELEDDTPSPEAACHQNQRARRLRAAIARLPEQQAIALTLYYNEDLTAGEVADIMGLRQNAVESLLKRGRQKLRALLLE